MHSDILKSWWSSILLYGLSLGLLLAALQFSQFRILTHKSAEKWYIGFIALLFAGLGIWAGIKWTKKTKAIQISVASAAVPRQEQLDKLGITPREFEVLEQIALGLSNQEIAEKLFVSLNTVKTHASNVFSKLGAQRRTQAIQQAKALGLLP